MMKRNFESGLLIGGCLGACSVMFALALCIGSKLVMGLGGAAILAGIVAIASICRRSPARG